MAAGTVTLGGANKKALHELFKRIAQRCKLSPREVDGGVYFFDSGSFTPASTSTDDAGDIIQVLKFPDGARLGFVSLWSTAEVDGGSALVWDLQVEDSAAVQTVLISATTVGRGASDEDDLDANLGANGPGLDVGGQWLELECTTPATSNAGTGAMRVRGWCWMGTPANPST